jgi:chromosome segregation ATPase
MKQPEDNATLELNLATAIDGARRGRGRPAKADALTPAERAKRYREAKRLANAKENAQSVTQITKKEDSPWSEQRRHLENQLKLAQAEIATLRRERKLLIAERAAAYRTYDQLAATMAGREDELLKAKTELAATRADHAILAAQGAALNELVRTLEERLKKRDSPRRK